MYVSCERDFRDKFADTTAVAQVKTAATVHAKTFAAEPELDVETVPEGKESAPVESTSEQVQTDPTVAYAGLTEIDTTGATAPVTNGHVASTTPSGVPASADVGDAAANAAAESQWDTNNDLSASGTQEDWVKVPRDPAETETGLEATPAAAGPVQSWADDQPEQAAEVRCR